MSAPVAVVGLGSMGAALADRLVDCGQEISTWNRSTDRPAIKSLVARGAAFSANITEAVEPCDTVIFCVLDYSSIARILEDINPRTLQDKTVINLTNGTVSQARKMSEEMLQTYGVAAYFDGAIMATPKMVGTEASFLFCSGSSREIFEERSSSVLQQFGRVDYLGADPGAAALHDLALLAGMYGMMDGTLTAIGLLGKAASSQSETGGAQGPTTITISTRLVPMLQALLPNLVEIAAQVESGDHDPGDHPNTMMLQGLRNIVETCEVVGVDAGAVKHLFSVFDNVEKEGGGKGGMGMVGKKYMY